MFKKVFLGLIFASSILSALTKPSPNNDFIYSQSQAQSIQDPQVLSSSNVGGFSPNGDPDVYSYQINTGVLPPVYSQSVSSSTFSAPPSPFSVSGGAFPIQQSSLSMSPASMSIPQSAYSLSGSPISMSSSPFSMSSSPFSYPPSPFPEPASSFAQPPFSTYSQSFSPIDFSMQSPFLPTPRPSINYNDFSFGYPGSSYPSMGYIKPSRPISNIISGLISSFGGQERSSGPYY